MFLKGTRQAKEPLRNKSPGKDFLIRYAEFIHP